MYTIFTNRYYILEFLKNRKKLEFVYCEKNSFAETFCKKNDINYAYYKNRKDSYKFLIKSTNKKIILNGYKFIITKNILKKFKQIPINIHPSLLPSYPGQLVVKKMFRDKPEYIGATVHQVSEIVDRGPILAQAKKKLKKNIKIIELYKILFNLELVAFKKYLRIKIN